MSESQHVIEIADASFETEVVARSRKVPVLVDFWAPWCGPCRQIGPVLEKLAGEMGGRFVLAKLNVDKNPAASARFGVQGIPAMKLFVDGEVAGELVGAQPEPAMRRWLDQHIPDEADALVERAEPLVTRGEDEGARGLLEEALAHRGAAGHPKARLLLARLAARAGAVAELEEHLEALPEGSPESREGAVLAETVGFSRRAAEAGGLESAARAVEADPADLDARLALGCALVGEARYKEALEAFLEVVRRDREYDEQAARRAMLTVFKLLGPDDHTVADYRRQLMILL